MQVFRDYEGREIRLTNERMAHVAQRHRELLRIENAIGDTLAKPDTFLYDEAIIYCRQYAGVHIDTWVLVVVAIMPDDAFILTAYTAKSLE